MHVSKSSLTYLAAIICGAFTYCYGQVPNSGQTTPKKGPAAAAPKKPAPATPAKLTVEDIIKLADAKLSDSIIVMKIKSNGRPFDLSPDQLVSLKKASVSDAVIEIMMDPSRAYPPPAPAKSEPLPTPVDAPAPPPPTAVVVQAPIAAVTAVNPSGATPAPATTAAGDPNDPTTPHDSGIYLYTKDRAGKPLMVVLERAAYQGAKTGGVFGTAITYGIKKMKTKAVIPGPRASIRTMDANPVFYFYFDDKAAGLGRSYFGGTVSNPNQFALLKLEVNKANRETIIMEANAFGASSGTNEKSMVGFKSERIRPGLYKVALSQLQQGEYCFMSSINMGAYGAGAAGATDIFDFGVSVE